MATAAARSDPGKVREANEDRWLIRDHDGVTLLAVADGVGGEEAGEVASAAAIESIGERFYKALPGEGVRGALTAAIRDANDAVLRASEQRGALSATTLVAAAVRGREAAIANLGDSRAYVVHRGKARQVTTDHSGPAAHQVTRFVGDERGVQPDVFVESLHGGDRLVLCSDGLTLHVSDDEIAARAAAAEPANAANELVALANERGGQDNVTVVVYRARGTRLAGLALALAMLLALVLIVVLGAIGAVVWRAP